MSPGYAAPHIPQRLREVGALPETGKAEAPGDARNPVLFDTKDIPVVGRVERILGKPIDVRSRDITLDANHPIPGGTRSFTPAELVVAAYLTAKNGATSVDMARHNR
jgi:hypothetical protein